MADDRLPSLLEEIRERQRRYADEDDSLHSWLTVRKTLCGEDVPRLLAVVDAALELAGDWEGSAAELDRDAVGARKSHYASDHRQADTDHELAGTLRECAEDLRETITRELTGEADDAAT